MKDKKHIDRLFQEKLKDFEVTPSDSVWDNISSELHISSKARKSTPVWWRVAGIAAGLLLLFTLGQLMLNDNTNSTIENVVDIDSEKGIISNDKNDNANDIINNVVEEKIVSQDSKLKSSTSSNSSLTNTNQNPNAFSNNKENFNNVAPSSKIKNTNRNSFDIEENEIVTTSSQTKSKITNPDHSNSDQENLQNNTSDIEKANTILDINNQSTEAVVVNPDGAEDIIELQEDTINEEDKLSLTEEIVTIAEEKEDISDNEENFKRWSAAPNIAPVYFNSLGKGSSIHPEFVNNSKTGDINMSYGITASYAINKKLSIRAGIHKVNLGYSTNNVVVYNNIEAPIDTPLLKLYKNIEMTEEAKGLAFISVDNFNFAQVPGVATDFIRSSIDQKLGFVEIPVELKYNLSNKKLNVNLIGGFSTLFLSDNEVYSVDNGKSTLLGKATNINNTSFSANFGLGLDFKMSDKFNLNLEPVFKYQLNTFNNTSGNFKPYFIGVYSGLSFKF